MPQIVTTMDQLEALVDAYLQFDEWAIDTETRGTREPYHPKEIPALDPLTNEVFWVSLAGPGRSDAIPIGHPLGAELRPAMREKLPQDQCPDPQRCDLCKHGWKYNKDGSVSRAQRIHNIPALHGPPPPQLTHEEVWPVLRPLLMGPARKWGHNLRYDVESLAKHIGGIMAPPYGDTGIQARLINENEADGYRLIHLSKRELGFEYDKSLQKGVDSHSFAAAGRYARLDALATWLISRRLVSGVAKERQEHIFELEMNVLRPVIAMETTGSPVDVDRMRHLEKEYAEKLAEIQEQIETYNGGPINLNASREVAALVYGKRGRKVTMFTERTSEPSTSLKALEKHAFKDPRAEDVFDPKNLKDKCVAAILEHAQLKKVHSTYLVNNLPAVERVGRIHGQFDQLGTSTGRFSARNPNLQNIPVRRGKEIRELFIAGEGYKLIVCDYSQVELRILAHFTQDPLLMKAYVEGFDLHSATARKAYGIPEDQEPDTRQRSLAKNVNFSMVYGATAYTLVQRYEVPEDEAENLVEAFYKTYRKVAPWQAQVLKDCRAKAKSKKRDGYHVDPYVETILKRRRRLPDIILPDRNVQVPGKEEGITFRGLRRRAERQAINTVIQGSAADVMKIAMVNLFDRVQDENLPLEFLMCVHDELVLRAPEDRADELAAITSAEMEGANMLTVPLVAEPIVCDNWGEGK